MSVRTAIVIGHGMVGHRFVEALRARDDADTWTVIVLGEEDVPAYDRVALSSYVGSWDVRELALSGNDFDGDGAVDLRVGVRAESIDPDARIVTTSTGEVLPLRRTRPRHRLVSVRAAGARPRPRSVLRLPHSHRSGRDPRAGRGGRTECGRCRGRRRATGLEAANALRQLGMTPHVVEHNATPHATAGRRGWRRVLARLVTDLGLALHTGTGIASITDGPAGVRVELSDGTVIDAALLVFSAGIRPRDQLARDAGLAVAERGGILADSGCVTSDPAVFAVGECAAVEGRCYGGLVAPGYTTAEVVADRLLGGDAVFPGADLSTKLKLLGVDVASFGDVHAATRAPWRWCSATPRRAPTPSSWSPTTRGLCSAASSSATRARTDRCVRSSDGSCPATPRH